MTRPLDGILVIDLTRVLAGPYCTMTLADLGAEVIKVERPGRGDDAREFEPFVGGESAYFMSVNRGKKSITLDMKHPKGREILTRLAEKADVLVENFTPGVMRKLGLGFDALAARNPRLIYASCSGFGQTGPYANRPAYDLIIQGMGGLMSITGPDREHPTKVGPSIADILAGTFTCIGILAALRHRDQTGQGQWVDVAMLDSVVATLENAVARYATTGQSPEPIGNRHPSISPFATVQTRDGYVNIACGNDELWGRFCQAAGLGHLRDDERFATNADRVKSWAELGSQINAATREKTTEEWLASFEKAGVPSGPINDIAAVLSDPQVLARQMITHTEHPHAGQLLSAGVPIKYSQTPCEVGDPAPLLGQHTREVLGRRLGLSDTQLDELDENGVFGKSDRRE